jgi:PadR family transcriptional regulator, regulatory protein PadR
MIHYLQMRDQQEEVDILQGTLNMMILRALQQGPANGYEIAKYIAQKSDELLQVEHGSLYPALRRLEAKAFIEAEWRVSSTNRKARYYTLTAAGRRQALVEQSRWKAVVHAVARAMRPA